MKGGTTVLYDFINMHPDFERASEKEIHYFSINYHKGPEWYFNHFTKDHLKLTGEASPTYFDIANTDLIPNLIKACNPGIKTILITRDPIERAVSHFNHLVKINKVPSLLSMDVNDFFSTPVEEAITQTTNAGYYLNLVLTFSSYYRKYLYFKSVLGGENILVIRNKDLKENPFEVMRKVFNYLGVKPIEHKSFRSFKYSAGTNADVLDDKVYDRLAGILYPDYHSFCKASGIEYSELKSPYKITVTPEDVHAGKDGWLFLKGGRNSPIRYYNEPDLFSDEMVNAWIDILEKRVGYLGRLNIKYVHLFVPNKLTVYPEYYADKLECFECSPLQKVERKIGGLEGTKTADHVIIPIDYFKAQKEQARLYWKTDTHWTFQGAYCAYQLICARLGKEADNEIVNRNKVTGNIAMDLGGKFKPAITEDVAFYNMQKNSRRVYANEIVEFKEKNGLENNEGLHIGSNVVFVNETAANPEKVILFGDSFSEYRPLLLTGMLAETFREVHFVWSANLDNKYINRVKPDIVITQTVERFMPLVPKDDFDVVTYARKKLKEFKKSWSPK